MKSKRGKKINLIFLPCFVFLWLFNIQLSCAADTLTAGKVMRDWEFLVSRNGLFQLQFFQLGSSDKHYLGIQMPNNSIPEDTVWVANRENPLTDTSGYLNITQDGNLVINDSKGTSITINSEKPTTSSNVIAMFLDSGNLVLRAGEEVVWQSFDHPIDKLLPGMKLGLFNLKQKQPRNKFLSSWLTPKCSSCSSIHSWC